MRTKTVYNKGKICLINDCDKHASCKLHCSNHYWKVFWMDKLFSILGGKICVHCGFKDKRALCFDHKNGGGRKDVEKSGGHRMMVTKYVNDPELAKKDLQVLCHNCNWIKKHLNGEHNVYYNR